MTQSDPLKNAYTDAPEMHPNLLMGSLQLMFWLFFHPSAWRNHVKRIDPDLRPDFCLTELEHEHWRSPVLRRLLVQGYIIWPCILTLGLWGAGIRGEELASSVALGVTFSIAFGIAGGVAGSIAGGVASGVVVFSLAGSVAGSIVGGVAGGVAGSMGRQNLNYTTSRQVGGGILGLIISALILVGIVFSANLAGNVLSASLSNITTQAISDLEPTAVENVGGIVAFGMTVGIAVGIAIGITTGLRTRRWRHSVIFSVIFSVVFVMAFVVAVVVSAIISVGVLFGASLGTVFILSYAITERIAGSWAAAVTGALGGGGAWLGLWIVLEALPPWPTAAFGIMSIIASLSLAWWRPIVLYLLAVAWHYMLLRIEESRDARRPSLLRYHAAFWDEYQRLRWIGLDEHLVLVCELNPVEGQKALDYLANSRQRWAAQAAQIELDARALERCETAEAIGAVNRRFFTQESSGFAFPRTFLVSFDEKEQKSSLSNLEGPASALLRSFSRVSRDVEAALRQESAYNQRLALSAVEDRLDGLVRELTRSSEKYATRFRPIAEQWRWTVAAHVKALAKAVEERQEIDNPYVLGVPLTAQQEIFVGRVDACARIEQLLLDRRRPPLLLYGQRRMGKTSLLNNLGRLLPSTIVPLFVDLQGPASRASDHAGLLYNLAQGMTNSARQQRDMLLPALSRDALQADPFTAFEAWLGDVERALGSNTVLLALDEFEVLDGAISRGRFDEDAVLGMLRHLIQHRPRFKVLIAGSHTLEEFQRWASYLINVQVVRVGYLRPDETRQLIERPVEGFALRYEPDAVARAMALTRGHPALTQLLCSEIVALKNEQPPAHRRTATLADVEAAVPEALDHGSFFFADIEYNQVDAAGLALLRWIAARGEGAAVPEGTLRQTCPDDAARAEALALLLRRDLLESVDGGYRFQVELIRRWFTR
jgi:hypothetical protein